MATAAMSALDKTIIGKLARGSHRLIDGAAFPSRQTLLAHGLYRLGDGCNVQHGPHIRLLGQNTQTARLT